MPQRVACSMILGLSMVHGAELLARAEATVKLGVKPRVALACEITNCWR
jgi:hypothetical protein